MSRQRIHKLRMKKLSVAVSVASRLETQENLNALRQLGQESTEIAEELSKLITKLRQVAAPEKAYEAELYDELALSLNILRNILGASNDVVIREFSFGHNGKIKGALIFIEGLSVKATINESIIKPLMYDSRFIYLDKSLETYNIEFIKTAMLSVGTVQQVTAINEVVDSCLSGDTILLINGFKEALIIDTRGWETRNVDEPDTESVVRGPREGFVETLRVNTALLRRKIKSQDFIIEAMKIGKKTKTDVCIAYLQGVANPRLIKEIKYRLKRIDTDTILESGYIEQFVEDAPFSIFPTVGNSERPDVVAAKILEGRAAILVDGTPFVLTVPKLFIENFQSPEDYYSRPYMANLIRLLRFVAFLISILAPAVYVSITTFHQELIPTKLLFTMAAAHEGVPFPTFLEAGIMGVIFEILREAGIRLPRPVGQAISIVGALVIGESAVSAGIIGAPIVIMVSLTAVSSFVVSPLADAGIILRIILFVLAGVMGGVGITIGLLGLWVHMVSLRSFGTPFLSPLAPLSTGDLKDVFIRAPIWTMLNRPRTIGWHNRRRQQFRLKPSPPPNNK